MEKNAKQHWTLEKSMLENCIVPKEGIKISIDIFDKKDYS